MHKCMLANQNGMGLNAADSVINGHPLCRDSITMYGVIFCTNYPVINGHLLMRTGNLLSFLPLNQRTVLYLFYFFDQTGL